MLLNAFRAKNQWVVILVPLLGLVWWIPAFLGEEHVPFLFDIAPLPLQEILLSWTDKVPLVSVLLAFLVLVGAGFMLVQINTRYMLVRNRTYLPALFFVIIGSSIGGLQRVNPVFFAVFFMILGLFSLINSQRHERLSYEIFNASFLFGMAALFYPFALFFLVLIWIALVILRPLFWREWFFSISGFLTPFILFTGFDFLVTGNLSAYIDAYKDVFYSSYDYPFYDAKHHVFFVYLFFTIFLASLHMIQVYPTRKILPRKVFLLFFWFFLLTLGVYFSLPMASVELILILAVPVSFLLANYFDEVRRVKVAMWLIWGFMATLAWIRYF
jgi:hypothetical protein